VPCRAIRHDRPESGLDQQTRWVPSRYLVPTSRVIWQRGRFRLHHSAVRLLVVSALFVSLPLVAGLALDSSLADPLFVGTAFALVWAFTISFLHHELAHAVVARHFGVETLAVGFHGNGAYVRFRPSSTGVEPRTWVWILAAGPLSNAVAGVLLLVGWWAAGADLSSAVSVFCLVAGVIELVWAFVTAVPIRENDGREIVDALRLTRSPDPA
jgi:hypothetical protein